MKIIRGLNKNTEFLQKGCVVSLGKFDGMHRGHQALIARVKEISKKEKLCSTIILFDPHPQEFFQKGNAPARLMRLREKLIYLREQKIDCVIILPFNHDLANVTAEDFVEKILIDYLHIKHLIIGDDFRFGKGRQGDFHLLESLTKQFDFTLQAMPTCIYQEQRVSSSAVRFALQSSNFQLAESMLGRKYSLHGRVAHGDKLGRTLGFPTANIFLHRDKAPISGIFAVRMLGVAEKPILGVANIGSRPTVGGTRVLLEVYLFDFDQDIYGKYVTVEILHKFRDEEKYDSLEALKEQIKEDVQVAKFYFNQKVM